MGIPDRAVLVTGSPAGSSMAFKYIIPLLLIAGSQAARQLRNNNAARDQRSLLNTFPFNSGAQEQHHGHHDDHHAHHEEAPVARQSSQDLGARFSFQGEDGPPSFDDVAAAPESGGKRCIDKVEMVEETEYDDVVECETVYEEKCEDETSGYTTNTKCSKWPKEVCS